MMLCLKSTAKTTLTNPSQTTLSKNLNILQSTTTTTNSTTASTTNAGTVRQPRTIELTPQQQQVKSGNRQEEQKIHETFFPQEQTPTRKSVFGIKRKKHGISETDRKPEPLSTQDGFVVGAYVKREQSFMEKEATGQIQFVYLANDNKLHTLKLLTDVKNVYSRQLPNMPKEYICKLVFNHTHRSIAVLKEGKTVIGGITYKTFEDQSFAEIAFCAVEGMEQVQGIGTRMMNYCKCYARKLDKVERFLTYADNNAIGYFAKQGFVKRTLPQKRRSYDLRKMTTRQKEADVVANGNGNSGSGSGSGNGGGSGQSMIPMVTELDLCKWAGYIKEYDGGTLMECELVPGAPYLNCPQLVNKHWEALEEKIRQQSKSRLIYPALSAPKQKKKRKMNPEEIPGLKEAGWTPDQLNRNLHFKIDGVWEPNNEDNLHLFLERVLKFLKMEPEAQPFLKPVTLEDAADYFDIIKNPMDLSRMEGRLEEQDYYSNLDIFKADFNLMLENCRLYNQADTFYYKYANRLEQAFHRFLSENSMEF